MPGHVTTAATAGHAAVYKDRPDFSAPVALDPAATPVEWANWRLEMDMHFAYTMASKALATAILDSVGESNKAVLKVAFHPRPLHCFDTNRNGHQNVPEACCAHRAGPTKGTGSPA